MNYPFKIEFIVFDENKELSQKQKEIKKQIIWDELRVIIKNVFNNDNNYKWLDRMEASVSSNDEKKQLRLSIDTLHVESKKYQHSIFFNQNHSCSKEYFTMEELKYISGKIKNGLEDFLHYKIDEPIIYIEMDEL
jgi:hypothetical protein